MSIHRHIYTHARAYIEKLLFLTLSSGPVEAKSLPHWQPGKGSRQSVWTHACKDTNKCEDYS